MNDNRPLARLWLPPTTMLRGPVARLPAPEATRLSVAVAWLSKPPITSDETPVAAFAVPAPTNAPCAVAWLDFPAVTALSSPEATLPPATLPIHEFVPLPVPSLSGIVARLTPLTTTVVASGTK